MKAYIILLALLVSGCSTLPATTGECAGLYTEQADVERCEFLVIRAETRKFEQKILEQEQGRVSAACFRSGGYYNANSRRCIYMGL